MTTVYFIEYATFDYGFDFLERGGLGTEWALEPTLPTTGDTAYDPHIVLVDTFPSLPNDALLYHPIPMLPIALQSYVQHVDSEMASYHSVPEPSVVLFLTVACVVAWVVRSCKRA